MSTTITIHSVGELLAHAKNMEEEAVDRYRDLAVQMEMHHNLDVAKLFSNMAEIESKHAVQILERAKDADLPQMAPWDFQWSECDMSSDGPESEDAMDEMHYLMTPHHALTMALRCERRAFDFYTLVLEGDRPNAVLELAKELRDEEQNHITLIEDWLSKTPKPQDDWDHDPDPPNHYG